MGAKAHWGPRTFVVTKQTVQDAKLGYRRGYCRVCLSDMQAFDDDSYDAGYRLLHYQSHTVAKTLGLWGKR